MTTNTDRGSQFATVTWDAPDIVGGDDYVEVNKTDESGQRFQIGSSTVTYAVTDTEGVLVTNCSFDIQVFGKVSLRISSGRYNICDGLSI